MTNYSYQLGLESVDGDVRNSRLYLWPQSSNELAITIEPPREGGPPVAPGDCLEVSFGRLLTASEVEGIVRSAVGPFVPRATGRSIRFTLPTTLSIDASGKLRVPLRIPYLAGPSSMPHGTFHLCLIRDGQVLAAADRDVALERDRGPGALPAIATSWRWGAVPKLILGAPASLAFAVVNTRCDRRGNWKQLVSDAWTTPRKTHSPRLRISIPPRVESGRAIHLSDSGEDFAGVSVVIDAPHGHGWHQEPSIRRDVVMLRPSEDNPTLLGPAQCLQITLRGVTPKQPGRWAVAVTPIDLPGHVTATFLLPFEVRPNEPDVAIHDFVTAPDGKADSGRVRLSWFVEGTKLRSIRLLRIAGGRAEQLLLRGAARVAGEVRVSLGELACEAGESARTPVFELQALGEDRRILAARQAFDVEGRRRLAAGSAQRTT